MPVLELEEFPEPKVCTRRGKEGRPGRTVHLTDDGEKTLCGQSGRIELVVGAKPADLHEVNHPCRKCLLALAGDARTRRFT